MPLELAMPEDPSGDVVLADTLVSAIRTYG
jgi:hypothetical protein